MNVWMAMSSRVGRRIAAVLVLCGAIPAILLAVAAARDLDSLSSDLEARRLSGVTSRNAEMIRSRLGAAATLVEAVTARDAGYDSSTLKQVTSSRAFKSVAVVDRDGPLAAGETPLSPAASQLIALEAGQTILMPVTLAGQLDGVFMAHVVSAGGTTRLAYFELAPDWLWRDLDEQPGVAVVVVDAQSRVLHGSSRLSAETNRMFAEHIAQPGGHDEAIETLSWQDHGQAWHGTLKHVPLVNERITSVPWGVVALTKQASFLERSHQVWMSLPLVLLGLCGCALVGTGYLSRRYLGAFTQLHRGLALLQHRVFEPLPETGSDEPRGLLVALNRATISLREQFHALETLGEIDRLLLGSAELEQVLEGILSRVQSVTRCHCVGITLRDADAPGRGRVWFAASGLVDLPVMRVELDDDMLSTLLSESGGLTVARCEDTRHSFLKPLKEAGAEFFWIWPVNVAERLEAILAVGYRDAPAGDAHLARTGSQFAARLAAALSKSARDERLYRQAHFDPLTSLPNRVLFRDRLAQEISNATAGLSRGALLYIDLDHFKRVNDSVGHGAGDQLLTIVAQRLRSCVKEGDTVARLGGDEFTVILRNVADPDAARSISERIIETLQLPVNIGGRDHFVCASIGITLFPDDGSGIDEVMRNADTAMYRAKDLGRGCTTFYDPRMNARPVVPTDSGLHRALRRREFSLFYQPQFAIASGALVGVEALLRWQTPQGAVRQPAEFVPAAEESGVIIDIGGWVLEAACAQLARWREQKIAPPRLSINVSVQQVRDDGFVGLLQQMLGRYGLPAASLELEMHEALLVEPHTVASLANAGVRLTLDDFATVPAALAQLRQSPFENVKLDRALLRDVLESPAAAQMVETLIALARSADKRVVAKGVETAEQLEFLRERRCDVAQGFYLARPLSSTSATEFLQARIASGIVSGDVREAG